jgi:hypothetical protein
MACAMKHGGLHVQPSLLVSEAELIFQHVSRLRFTTLSASLVTWRTQKCRLQLLPSKAHTLSKHSGIFDLAAA